MKMIVRRIPSTDEAPFAMDQLRTHIRVDFDESDVNNELIRMGRTAAAEIEQFAQIALITQTILVTIFDPQCEDGLRLPIGPVLDDTVPRVSIDGQIFTAFDFVPGNRPYIHWHAPYRRLTPTSMVIEYQAGFGPSQVHVPFHLTQAVLDQTALHYDGRSPMNARDLTTSPHMARIAARYRGVQL